MSEQKATSKKREGLENVMRPVAAVLDSIYGILLIYSKVVLLLIVAIVSVQVFYRKVLGTGITWSEEVALLLMVWMAFISMAIGVEKKTHIAIEMFYNRFPKRMQSIVTKINTLIIASVGAILIIYGVKLIIGTFGITMPATQWPTSALYFMIPVGGFFMLYFALFEFLGLSHLHEKLHKQNKKDNEVTIGGHH